MLGKFFGKKVFFDIFASTHETYVKDRKIVDKKSFRAKFYFLLDWLDLRLADFIITDTEAHLNYYHEVYGLNKNKGITVYVGSDPDYFYPRKTEEETDVLFYGSYQPLQGAEVIVKAAAKLPKVKFKLIGGGQTRESTQDLAKELKLKNIEFIDWLSLEKLSEEISRSKITLGIFGNTKKARVVIPNKVYDYMACSKPVITGDTEAARELLDNNQSAILIPLGDHISLAEAINSLMKNAKDRETLAKNGFRVFTNKLVPKKVVGKLIDVFS